MLFLGIDPGESGGFAILQQTSETFRIYMVCAYTKNTPSEIFELLNKHRQFIQMVYIENVHSMPGQGVASTFKFGKNYGWWLGILTALQVPFEYIQPLKWQTMMSCKTKGDKNISKIRAQGLFPTLKITHAIADALLIAEYCRRQCTIKSPSANFLTEGL